MADNKKNKIKPTPTCPILETEQHYLSSNYADSDCRIDEIFQAYYDETEGMDGVTLVETQIERERRLRKSLIDNKLKNCPNI